VEQVARGASVYLDANLLIRMTEGTEDDRQGLALALAPYVEAEAVFITSELSFTEVLVHPLRHAHQARVERYHQLFSEFVEPMPVTREVLFLAARLRAEVPALRTPDAIHTATARLAKASVFLTADQGIKPQPPDLRVRHV
jgi:predicted nucleic acid-binding protein